MKTIFPVLLFIAGLWQPLAADTNQQMQKQQEEMQKVFEMMQGSGVDAKQMQQMQGMMQFMMNKGMQMKQNETNQEKAEFAKKMANNGKATVETEGQMFNLSVTKCEVKNREAGLYTISAKQGPGGDDAELQIQGDDQAQRSQLQFNFSRKYNSVQQQNFNFDGKSLTWEGQMSGDHGAVALALNLDCGAEALFLDQPSTAKSSMAKNEANVLTFKLGDESYEFEAGLCSTKKYRTGNLMVVFEATATGSFRGRPAVILLSKSHPVGQTKMFDNMSLLLTELTPEQRQLAPLKVRQQLDKVINDYQTQAIQEHQKKYDKDFYESVAPEKLLEVMNQTSTELDVIMDKAKAMKYPAARGHGAITIKGKEVLFRSARKLASGNSNVPEFKDLPKQSEIWLRCKD